MEKYIKTIRRSANTGLWVSVGAVIVSMALTVESALVPLESLM